MQNHYAINVALNGRHFFATAPRSCVTAEDATRVLLALRERFPEAEGFEVTCTHWEAQGRKFEAGA